MHAILASDQRHSSVEAYSLPPPRLHSEVERLLRKHPAAGSGRFAVYRIRGTNEFSDIARSIETEVFQRFFGNTPQDLCLWYGPYDAYSHFIVAVDREAMQPAGMMRVIEDSALGLKSLNDIREAPLELSLESVLAYHGIDDLRTCWDVGSLAVRKPYRGEHNGHVVGTMLYGTFIASARAAGIQHAVAILDGHAYRQLTEMLGLPFETIAGTEPFEYLGAKGSRAAYLPIQKISPAVEQYMERLDTQTRASLRPSLARVIYAEGLPALVDVA